MEEYLKICEQNKQTEACALLCKKIGAYKEAVHYYLELMEQQLNIRVFLKELYDFDKYIRLALLRQKRELHNREIQAIEKEQQRMRDQQVMQSLDVSEFA